MYRFGGTLAMSLPFTRPGRLSTFASNPNDRAVPGVRVHRRLGKGFTLDASFTPRYVPQSPSLERLTPRSTGVFGTFLAREWKF